MKLRLYHIQILNHLSKWWIRRSPEAVVAVLRHSNTFNGSSVTLAINELIDAGEIEVHDYKLYPKDWFTKQDDSYDY